MPAQSAWLQNTPTESLLRGKNPSMNKCPRYNIKPADGEVPVLELWEDEKYSIITITHWLTLTGSGINVMVPSMGLIIIIIIIIMLRYQHGYSWPSLATPPYRLLLSADPEGYIPYRHRAAVCRFELDVLPLLVHGKGSTGVHHLWARPYFFSSSVQRV